MRFESERSMRFSCIELEPNVFLRSGTPGRIRTYGLLLRRQKTHPVVSNTCMSFLDDKWTEPIMIRAPHSPAAFFIRRTPLPPGISNLAALTTFSARRSNTFRACSVGVCV